MNNNCAYLRQWAAVLVLIGVLISDTSSFDYCTTPCVMKQTYKHTMCLYPKEVPGPLCKALDSGKKLTEDDKEQLVKLHNKLRSKVAEGKESRGSPGPQPPASNMMELVWDNELELIARRWALQCDYKHDQCRATKDRTYAGQNLAVSYDSVGFQNDLEKQVMSWYDEVELTPRNTVDTFLTPTTESGDIGHYTQLVWADTSRIGCARVFFDFSDWGLTEYLVCNYAQGGNVKDQPMYKQGKHCSACADGLKCSTKYPGLCASPGSDRTTTARPGGEHGNDKTADQTAGTGSGADLIHWKLMLTITPAILVTVKYLTISRRL